MSILAGITAGATIAKKTGITGAIGGLFGKKSDPNRGTADLVDTLDNYDSISTSKARQVAEQVKGWIASGMSDNEIYSRLKTIRGVSQSRTLSNDPKYRLVQQKIDALRYQFQQAETASQPANNYTNNQPAGNAIRPAGLNLQNPASYMLPIALLIAGFFAYQNLK